MCSIDLHIFHKITKFVKTNKKNDIIMAKMRGAITVNSERCKGCRLCVVACPFGVIDLHHKEVNNRGYHFAYMANPDACTGCTSCALVCPDACIEVYRAAGRE